MPNTNLATTEIIDINPPKSTELEPSPEALPEKPAKRFLCLHIFADGRRCGAPALRGEYFCYHHYAHRITQSPAQRRRRLESGFDLTLVDNLDNPASIQITVAEVVRRLASNTIEPKRAGLILYALQVGSQNLRRAQPVENSRVPEEIVEHHVFGPLARMEPGRTDPQHFDLEKYLGENTGKYPSEDHL